MDAISGEWRDLNGQLKTNQIYQLRLRGEDINNMDAKDTGWIFPEWTQTVG